WIDSKMGGRRQCREPPAQQELKMPNYMLLLHTNPSRPRPTSPDEIMAITKAYMDWADRMRADGRLKGGEKLTFDAGKVMRPNGGRVTVTDGPYAESKELIGGYFAISARNYDEACRIAESCPHLGFGGTIEVRQVDHM
ncbi:MAG TPA: YciI family protein, partial [Xanthobacteraceae bacterium]|nr:YciI family protein [Xanthobacteraceae bacterium]